MGVNNKDMVVTFSVHAVQREKEGEKEREREREREKGRERKKESSIFLVIAEWQAASSISPSHGDVLLTSVDLCDLCHEHVSLQHVLKPNDHMTP